MRSMSRAGFTAFIVFVAVVGQMVIPGPGTCGEEGISSSDIELLRSDIRTKKAARIADRMQFSNKEADAFWPVYRKYEVELAAINDKKIALIKDYMSHYETLDNKQAKELAQGVIEVDQMTLDLRKKYFGELEKVLPAKTVTRFLQIERRLQLFMDVQIASDFPAIKK
jgi:hypothetical protein